MPNNGIKGDGKKPPRLMPRVMVRHEVAQFECTQVVIWSTRYVPAGPYAGVLPSR